MRKGVLLFLGLMLFQLARAQYIEEVDSIQPIIPKLSIKYYPSHLVGHFPANIFGAEFLVAENIGIEGRYGRISDRAVYDYDEIYYQNKSGFKSSLMVKFYFKDYELNGGLFPLLFNVNRKDETFEPFFSSEIFYNNIQYDRERTFKLSCGDDCEYYSEIEYGLERRIYGGRFHIGFISQIAGPVFFEGSIAFGLMGFDLIADNRRPVEYERQYGYLFEEDNSETVLPTVDLSFKLVFRILK